jgi:hypothetical protein
MAKKQAAKPTPKHKPEPEPKPAPKKHERTAKPSEMEHLAKGRQMAANYLAARDGMSLELAEMVVEGMDGELVNTLLEEANTKVIARTETKAAAKAMPSMPEPEEYIPDFVTVDKLITSEEFADYAQQMIDAAKIKNQAEQEYRRLKTRVIGIMDDAATPKVMFLGYRLSRYEGNNRTLSAQLLIEKGIDPEVISQCYKDSKYQDVRITPPSKPKEM